MRALTLLPLAILLGPLAGCAMLENHDAPPVTTGTPVIEPPVSGPPVRFGGLVLDARTGEPVPNASVRVDLSQVLPCRREAIVWTNKDTVTNEAGRFGPVEFPRPRSDDVAFFVHVDAADHTENATFIGPAEARGDPANLTFILHPAADINGSAPPGTVIALDDERFPRVTVADAEGRYRFEGARVVATRFVAATDEPLRAVLSAPVTLDAPATNASGWRLEGKLVSATGAPMTGDVVARNGTELWSVARANEDGVFVLPLPRTEALLQLDARTADGHYGATRTLDVKGSNAVRETLIMRALC